MAEQKEMTSDQFFFFLRETSFVLYVLMFKCFLMHLFESVDVKDKLSLMALQFCRCIHMIKLYVDIDIESWAEEITKRHFTNI